MFFSLHFVADTEIPILYLMIMLHAKVIILDMYYRI